MLCVCTGNVARSPVLELVLDAATDASVVVASAGTRAVQHGPVAPTMAALLRERSISAEAFRSRDLTAELARGADLVLCLDATHRQTVLTLAPAALRRTFSLREFARLAAARAVPMGEEADDAARLRAVTASALALRGGLGPSSQDDIADPMGGPESAYRAAFDDITDATARIAAAAQLRGTVSPLPEEDL